MVKLKNKVTSKMRVIYWLLAIEALLVTVYTIWSIQPLFNAYFVMDDFPIIDLGISFRTDPFSFLSFTWNDTYRPLGFTLPGLIYLVCGLNINVFHCIGLIIHLVTALVLWRFVKRFLDPIAAFISYSLFIASTIIVISVGYSTVAFQDELSVLFVLLGLSTQIRSVRAYEQIARPYFSAAMFLCLALMCKESSFGMIFSYLSMDFLNYPKAKLIDRIKRLYPFILTIAVLSLRFLVLDPRTAFLESASNYAENSFSLANLVWGLTLPFLPFAFFSPFGSFDLPSVFTLLGLIVPVVLFVILPIFWQNRRKHILIMATGFMGTLCILSITNLNNIMQGWQHLTSLVPIMAVFGGMILCELVKKQKALGVIVAFVLMTLYILGQRDTTKAIIGDVMYFQKIEYEKVSKIKKFFGAYPPNSNIYTFDISGIPFELLLEQFKPKQVSIKLIVVNNYQSRLLEEQNQLLGSWGAICDYLSKQDLSSVYFATYIPGIGWMDITSTVLEELK